MVKLIMGLKGSGKTKQLVTDINEAVKNETGSMVCIEKGTKLRYDIDIRVRLIDYQEYSMGTLTFLKGFISGLHAGNFDISHIFIDSFYKLVEDAGVAEVEDFVLWCDKFGAANNMSFTVVVSEDPEKATEAMKAAIDAARAAGESLGGTFRVVATGLLPGVGGYATAGERLTGRIGGALFSIPAIKGVEFGLGFQAARRPGSQVHDPIELDPKAGFTRTRNNAGGLEGGMTTGMPLIVTAAMKPIPTLMTPLATVNLDTLEPEEASRERSDVCAVPACAVVAEAEVAIVLADAYLEKFGHDNMTDIKAAVKSYRQRLRTLSR